MMKKAHLLPILLGMLLIALTWRGLAYLAAQGALMLPVALASITCAYMLGLLRLWGRAGWGHGLPLWRAACFLAGMLALGLALSGPLEKLADGTFSIHMIQHMLLVKAVPPLLLLGEFPLAALQALGARTARWISSHWTAWASSNRVWKQFERAWPAWGFFAACLWVWHTPALFQAALEKPALHDLEHFMFLSSSMWFWWYLLRADSDRTTRYGAAVLYLFTTLLHESVLGALLTFSSNNWYPAYQAAGYWRISPLADQQLAGTIMWLPGGVIFGLLIVLYFGAWLRAIEGRMQAAPMQSVYTGDRHD